MPLLRSGNFSNRIFYKDAAPAGAELRTSFRFIPDTNGFTPTPNRLIKMMNRFVARDNRFAKFMNWSIGLNYQCIPPLNEFI